jgi:transposase
MADQASASSEKPTTNGTGKVSWTQTTEGRKKLADAQRAAHARAKQLRSTSPVPEEKVKRLRELIRGGSSVKDAAQLVGIGYSTAQRYAKAPKTAQKTAPKATPKPPAAPPRRSGGPKHGFRLDPAQIKMIQKLLPRMPELSAREIAKRAKCHLSSVYHYRRQVENGDGASPRATVVATANQASGLSAEDRAAFRDAYKTTLEEMWSKRMEPTNGELKWIRAWRQLNGE